MEIRRLDGAERDLGVVLIWVLFALVTIAGVVLAGTAEDMALDKGARFEVSDPAHARAVAGAGIVDAFAWFRRQQVQPVSTFAPQRDMAVSPPVNETEDPTIGLVREYSVAPSLWGRYEVRLSQAAEPFTDADGDGRYDAAEAYTDLNGNGTWDPARETRDVSGPRGLSGNGQVWLLVSHGFLYRRADDALPLGQGPNVRLAGARVATEIRRLTIAPPAAAAICCQRGDRITIGARGRIVGGDDGAGLAYANGTGSPSLLAGSEVTGTPATSPQPAFDTSLESVFGVGADLLQSMADISTDDPTTVTSPLGDYTLTVVEGDIVFDEARPLRGTGVLIVLGSCTIQSGSNSFFSGLLWVRGDLIVRAPAYLRGVLLSGGSADVRGVGGDYAEVNYDDSILRELLFLMGQYRYTKAIYEPRRDSEVLGPEGG